MTWNIVSDSSCDLPMNSFTSDRVHFEIVPLRIQVGSREFVDNDELEVPDLLAAMADEKSASSTACPSPAAFARAFEAGDQTVCFTISANLSGTYNAAVMGREMVLEEHPEKKICIIDSKATAGAMVLLIRRAKELMETDTTGDFEGICAQLRLYQAALRTCFTLENFDNLIKNGRMRPLVGTLLRSLGIHVIADATPQGTIHVADKARGEAKTWKDGRQQRLRRCRGGDFSLREHEGCGEAEGADPDRPAGEECGDHLLPGTDQLLRHGKGTHYWLLND